MLPRSHLKWLCLLALCWQTAAAQPCVKSVRWHEDPPFSHKLPGGEIVGLQVELHRAVLQRMDCRMVLLDMPFARALVELEAGRLDLLPGTFARPERQIYAHFSQAPLTSRNLLYVRKAELARWREQGLLPLVSEGFRLGAQIGVVYGPAYADLMHQPELAAKVIKAPQRSGLWQMLARQRIDGLIADEASADHELRELGLQEQIQPSGLVVSNEAVGTAFSKRSTSAEFVARFNTTLDAMRRDGSLAQLLERYGLKP